MIKDNSNYHPEKNLNVKRRYRIRLIDVAIIVEGILIGLLVVIHSISIWLIFPILLLAIYIYKNKPDKKEEKERRELISNQAFAFGLLLPVFIIMVFLVYFAFKLIPIIVQNWQG